MRTPVDLDEARGCTRCPQLVASRRRVVLGRGGGAGVLLVGEAPGREEDERDLPLAGRPAELLDRLLRAAGLDPGAVAVTNAVLCRPPDNREPLPAEVASCRGWLDAQVEAVAPVVIGALGGSVTKLLLGGRGSIRDRRGREEPAVVAGRSVWVLPLFDPAAALYSPPLVEQLGADLARIPGLVAAGPPERPPVPADPSGESGRKAASGPPGDELRLF